MHFPPHLSLIIENFKKLPGIGQKSAERFAFKVLEWPTSQIEAFSQTLLEIQSQIHYCSSCGAIAEKNNCLYCNSPQRSKKMLCIVAHAKDIFTLEETHCYKGLYHVLGGLLSPMHHRDETTLNIEPLKHKIEELSFEEIIFALDSTIEGDATTLFLKKELNLKNITISRLAFGIPVGSSLEYIDGNTLSRALSGRLGF
ncbi:MAG: Recombination protein RecR [Chlamydiae bacterium]|nr:Recombination protein RecR [Chlamydiota bacterium]